MKKPDEIKDGLKCCHINDEDLCECEYCPYAHKGWQTARCDIELAEDALFYIQHLESKLHQAVEDIRMLGRTGEFVCPVCAHYNHGEGTKGECVKCLTGDGFRWRGENNEAHNH